MSISSLNINDHRLIISDHACYRWRERGSCYINITEAVRKSQILTEEETKFITELQISLDRYYSIFDNRYVFVLAYDNDILTVVTVIKLQYELIPGSLKAEQHISNKINILESLNNETYIEYIRKQALMYSATAAFYKLLKTNPSLLDHATFDIPPRIHSVLLDESLRDFKQFCRSYCVPALLDPVDDSFILMLNDFGKINCKMYVTHTIKYVTPELFYSLKSENKILT
jgi:hypothetical protein